jgi:chlorobactene glucosyltransferase
MASRSSRRRRPAGSPPPGRSPPSCARSCRRARSDRPPRRRPERTLTGPGLLHLHILGLAAAALLLALALRTEEWRRRAPGLPAPAGAPGRAGEPPAEVTVLLPLRDEEENVLPCLDGLLAQTVQPRLRAIDDGSRDATARLAAARRREAPRLELLQAGPLPPGWRGKVHALAVGAAGVESPWLLLTDADTRHHPELLERALAAAGERRLDAVSLAGGQEAAGVIQALLVPAMFALLDTLLGSWEAAAEGGPAVANGQYILVRREALERSGGFAALASAPADDVALAARLRAAGHRTGFFRAPGLLTVRMYRGGRDAVHGWRRNLGGLLGGRPATAATVLALAALPALALLLALATGRLLSAAILWAGGAAASAIFRRGSGHPPAWGLLYPLDALLLAWVLARGALDWRRGRLPTWKGREMRVRA